MSNTSSAQDNGFLQREANAVLVEPSKSNLSIAGGLSASRGTSRSYGMELPSSQSQIAPVRDVDNTYGVTGVTTRGSTGGLTGLLNLGNTCFMNSAIQCLVHTLEFARYFQEDYHPEINWQNPLGLDVSIIQKAINIKPFYFSNFLWGIEAIWFRDRRLLQLFIATLILYFD